MSLGNALAIFLPLVAGVAGGGGGASSKSDSKGRTGFDISSVAQSFLDMTSGEKQMPFSAAPTLPRNRTIQELTRGGNQNLQRVTPPGTPFEFVDMPLYQNVMQRLAASTSNSQVRDLMYTYANPVEPEETSTGTGQVQMTEVNVRP